MPEIVRPVFGLSLELPDPYKLKLPDAIQLASALAINADALVTHDRDFAKVRGYG